MFESIVDGSLAKRCGLEGKLAFRALELGHDVLGKVGPFAREDGRERALVVSMSARTGSPARQWLTPSARQDCSARR